MASDNRIYVSVMTTPAASGETVFELETYNCSPNITLSLSVTGIATTDSEIDIAKKIDSQIGTQLIQYSASYDGQPVFHNDTFPSTFRIGRSEHIVSFWSQSQFSLVVDSDDTGCIYNIASTPTLTTNSKAQLIAVIQNLDLEDEDGGSLSDDEIALLLEVSSARLVSYLNNNIVKTTYLFEHIGNTDRSVSLSEGKPIIKIDSTGIVRSPNNLNTNLVLANFSTNPYILKTETGRLSYRYFQTLLESEMPFKRDYEFRITYQAGNFNIHKILHYAVLKLARSILDQTDGNIKSLTGQSHTVTFFSTEDA